MKTLKLPNDILKELYVTQKIERGLEASDADKVIPQDEVVKRYIG